MIIESFATVCFPDDPVLDVAYASALLRRVASDGTVPSQLRIYRPAPTLSFGRLEFLKAEFVAAAAQARRHGFAPVVRNVGGRATAYHRDTVVVEIVARDEQGMFGSRDRFCDFTTQLLSVLRRLGVDARIGPVPGEYCPGEWTINGAGRVKLVGTAQRIVAGGFLFGAELVVRDPEPIRSVLADVNRELGADFDPRTAAALTDLTPGLSVEETKQAILDEFGAVREIAPDTAVIADARRSRMAHSPEK